MKRDQEVRAEHRLVLQLIDIGYKGLVTKLHPDKGESRDRAYRSWPLHLPLSGWVPLRAIAPWASRIGHCIIARSCPAITIYTICFAALAFLDHVFVPPFKNSVVITRAICSSRSGLRNRPSCRSAIAQPAR
jgi:hypothetical protein